MLASVREDAVLLTRELRMRDDVMRTRRAGEGTDRGVRAGVLALWVDCGKGTCSAREGFFQ